MSDKSVTAVRQPRAQIIQAADGGVLIPCEKSECVPLSDLELPSFSIQNRKMPADCHQRLWFSFFFDGTGNNLNADLGSEEHTNVARLYRAHSGGFCWQPDRLQGNGRAPESAKVGVQGFIVELPIMWTASDNNVSGMNRDLLAENDAPDDESKSRPVLTSDRALPA